MKNSLKLLSVFMIIFSSFVFGQNYVNANADELLAQVNDASSSTNTVNRKKMCYTVSCCGIGGIGIEIWSETTCYYVVTTKKGINSNVAVINVGGNATKATKSVNVPNDFVLAGSDLSSDQVLVMKAGDYRIVDGQVAFEPVLMGKKMTCIIKTINGTIFGNPYSYSGYFCFGSGVVIWGGSKNSGQTDQVKSLNGTLVTLDVSKDENLLKLAKANGGYLEFTAETKISFDELKATSETPTLVIPKGKYTLSDDNMIYIQNAKFE